MTFLILQHPIILILFLLSAVLTILAGALRSYSFIPALFAGLTAILWMTAALVLRFSLDRILALLLVQLLLCCITFRKGESL